MNSHNLGLSGTMVEAGGQHFSTSEQVRGRVIRLQSGLPLLLWRGKPVLRRKVNSTVQTAVKRALDVVIAALAMVLLIPVLAGVAVAIRSTSRGKVLFRQRRVGLHGQDFHIYKFRTMYEHRQDLSGVAQTMVGDPRVTPVGRWLRRTSLDELPQLFNVLCGQMSLVGPRPHVAGMFAGGRPYDELVSYYDERLRVRPGISGWAQINGLRGPTTDPALARARVDHDIAYIQNYSLRLDLLVLWRTLVVEVWQLSGH